MDPLRRLRRFLIFGGLTLICVASTAEAQCSSGLNVAICPAADAMFINRGNTLTALILSSRAVKWHIQLPEYDSDFVGPVATASAVAVWAGFPATRIDAFDAVVGKPLWTIKTSADDMTALGHLIFFNDAAHWEGMAAVDASTGKRIWRHTGSGPSRNDRVRFFDSEDRTLLTNLFAIDAYSGRIHARWPKSWIGSAGVLTNKFAIIGTSWASGEPTKLAAYSLPEYRSRWVKDDPQKREVRGLAADGDHIFAALYPPGTPQLSPGEVGLELLDASSGKTLWTKTIMSASTELGPVGLTHGVAVFVTGDSADSSVVEGFDAATGEPKWTVHVPEKLVGDVLCADTSCYIEAVAAPGHVLAVDVQTGVQSWFRAPN